VNDEQFDLVGVPVPAGGTWRRASGAVRGAGRVDLLRGARALCRRLDGIPLALELAATRVRILTAREIEEGLTDRFRLLTGGPRDAPSRQRTLEASLDWSYGLLEPSQQLALARLSVFVGTFDLEAARSVIAGDGIGISGVLDLLTALAERSLLQVEVDDGRARYRLPESVRLYASARLAELDDPDRVLDRHLEFHVELAEQARAGLAGRHARPWTARLAAALDDLSRRWTVGCHRSVLGWCSMSPSRRSGSGSSGGSTPRCVDGWTRRWVTRTPMTPTARGDRWSPRCWQSAAATSPRRLLPSSRGSFSSRILGSRTARSGAGAVKR
jgi:hypothetical protein